MDCPLCLKQTIDPIQLKRKEYGLCTNCDLLFLLPQFHLSEIEEFKRYLSHNNDDNDVKYKEYLLEGVKFAVQFFSSFSGKKVLDFGSGKSKLTAQLFEGFGGVAQLYDPYFYKEIPNDKFDCVFACEVVEHFRRPIDGFNMMKSFLNSSGVLVVRTQLRPSLGELNEWWYLRDQTHVSLYSNKTLSWIERTQGLKLININKDLFAFQLLDNLI